MKVLLVDDDESVLDLLEEVVRALGHECLRATKVKDAQSILHENEPDALIVDGLLPDGSGIDFLKTALANSARPPKTVFFSAFFKGYSVFKQLREIGVDRILHKPIDFRMLQLELENLLGRVAAAEKEATERATSSELEILGEADNSELEALEQEYDQLRIRYANSLPEKAQELESLLRDGSKDRRERLQSFIHKLSGGAGTYGYPGISEAAFEIEEQLDADKPLEALAPRLETLLQRLQSEKPVESDRAIPLRSWGNMVKRILLIDDDVELGQVLRQDMAGAGIVLDQVQDADTAIERLQQVTPDIILVDYRLSANNHGPKLIERIESLIPDKNRLVYLTRFEGLEERVNAARTGSQLYLTKPLTASDLLSAIQHHLMVERAPSSILIFDDDPQVVELVRTLVEPTGVYLIAASDPESFWEAVEHENPSLILLDVQLPLYSGFELCRVLKADPKNRNTPVIILTAKTRVEDRIAAFESGAEDYVPKPIIPQEFVARIRARLRQAKQIESRALNDHLTGLLSRMALDDILERMIRQARRNPDDVTGSTALMIMDLDDFKRVNDEAGHLVGDRALQLAAQAIQLGARATDYVGRWGGEEFVAIMRNIREDEIRTVFERIRDNLLRTPVTAPPNWTATLTFSAGAAMISPADDLHSLTGRADEALYKSKQAGKNRLTLGD